MSSFKHNLLALFWWVVNSPFFLALALCLCVAAVSYVMAKTLILETSDNVSYRRVDAGQVIIVGDDVGTPDAYQVPAPAEPPVYPGRGLPDAFLAPSTPGLVLTGGELHIESPSLIGGASADDVTFYDFDHEEFDSMGGVLQVASYGHIVAYGDGSNNGQLSVLIGVRNNSGAFFGSGILGTQLGTGAGVGYGAVMMSPGGDLIRSLRSNIFPDQVVRFSQLLYGTHANSTEPNEEILGDGWTANGVPPDANFPSVRAGGTEGDDMGALQDPADTLTNINEFTAYAATLFTESLTPCVAVVGAPGGGAYEAIISSAFIR